MGTIQSLERGLRILDALREADDDPMRRGRGVSIAVLAAELEVHRTTALRLVHTLVDAGYAAPVEGRGGYRLGPSMRRSDERTATGRGPPSADGPAFTRGAGKTGLTTVSASAPAFVFLLLPPTRVSLFGRNPTSRRSMQPIYVPADARCGREPEGSVQSR